MEECCVLLLDMSALNGSPLCCEYQTRGGWRYERRRRSQNRRKPRIHVLVQQVMDRRSPTAVLAWQACVFLSCPLAVVSVVPGSCWPTCYHAVPGIHPSPHLSPNPSLCGGSPSVEFWRQNLNYQHCYAAAAGDGVLGCGVEYDLPTRPVAVVVLLGFGVQDWKND